MSNFTPDQLTAAITANNTDLLVIYPTGGPMKGVQWSVLKALMVSQLGTSYLQVASNLSDVGSPTTARNNLGLGTAALANTGTSGTNVPLLSTANTWTLSQTFSAATVSGAAATSRVLTYATAGSPRWAVYANNTAESGANVGSDLFIGRYSDLGAFIDAPIAITRSTGLVTMTGALTVAGVVTITTATPGDNTTKAASTAFVTAAIAAAPYAPLASPTLTGTPAAPTAALATNTTQIATTAFVLANSAPVGKAIHVQGQQTSGSTSGETIASITWTKRTLNTVVTNTVSGASLASSQVTLPTGTYLVTGSGSYNQTTGTNMPVLHRLRDTTHSATLLVGTHQNAVANEPVCPAINGVITISGATVVELDTYSASSASGTGGLAASSGEVEVYADICFTKIA